MKLSGFPLEKQKPFREARTLRASCSRDQVDKALQTVGVDPRSCTNTAYFFHGFLRAQVPRAHKKYNVVDEPEGVAQHELLHFPVIYAAHRERAKKVQPISISLFSWLYP